MTIAVRLEIEVPKHHLMYHLIQRSREMGNPWSYTTFEDESLNKMLKRTLRTCHQSNFESMAFHKLQHCLERLSVKRKRE